MPKTLKLHLKSFSVYLYLRRRPLLMLYWRGKRRFPPIRPNAPVKIRDRRGEVIATVDSVDEMFAFLRS